MNVRGEFGSQAHHAISSNRPLQTYKFQSCIDLDPSPKTLERCVQHGVILNEEQIYTNPYDNKQRSISNRSL